MNSAATTAVVHAVGEAQYSVTSESEPELAESSDEESSDEAEPGCARPSRKETVEARVQQWSAGQLWEVPQFRERLVKEMKEAGCH